MLARAVAAAAGDLNGILDRLGQVGEQLRHLARALEIMLRAQAPPLVDRDIASLGDADQRVMRFEIVGGREVRLVGGDDGQMVVVGEVEEQGLGRPLLRQPVPLQFDIEAVAEDTFERIERGFGKPEIVGGDSAVDYPVRAAGERDEAFLVEREMGDRDKSLAAVGAVAVGLGGKLDEIGVAVRIFGKKSDTSVIDVPPRFTAFRLGFGLGGEAQRQGAADDRLDARLRQAFGEFECAE